MSKFPGVSPDDRKVTVYRRVSSSGQRDDLASQRLVVAHKDRLARFGFEYLEHEARTAGCELLVANQETLSPKQETVGDLLSIVRTFSCRLSGLRRYEKKMKSFDLAGDR